MEKQRRNKNQLKRISRFEKPPSSMTVYYKFFRPPDANFCNKERAVYSKIFIPSVNDPTEKYCYAEIPEDMFSQFLEDFPAYGEILPGRKDFPDSTDGIATGRDKKFIVVEPKKG